VPIGRVLFEIGGAPIREELAREGPRALPLLSPHTDISPALRQASDKLPTQMEFINRSTPPRLGNLLIHPPSPPTLSPAAEATPST
jgi:hypothetical protein